MDIKQISALIKLFSETGLKRLDVSEGELKLVLEAHDAAGAAPQAAGPETGRADGAVKPVLASQPEDAAFVQASPIVGTVYLSAEPGGEPLVKVGDVVTEGQPLCVVEAMKMFSNLNAQTAGVITEICVENGQPVGIGQALFKIMEEQRLAS